MSLFLDDLIRDRAFQPLVDRLQIDPLRAAASVHRFHAITMTTGIIAAGIVMLPLVSDAGSRLVLIVVLLLPFYTLTYQVARRLRRQPFANMGLDAALQRLLMTAVGLFSLVTMPSVVIAPGADVFLRLTALSWSIGVPSAAIAVYLQICRKPPPRRKSTAPQPART